MPKRSDAIDLLPAQARQALARLGAALAIARRRRRESQRRWAARLGVSAPTVVRMERGDPSVGAGIYATALWMIGRAGALGELAAPEHDRGALELEIRAASGRRRAAREEGPR